MKENIVVVVMNIKYCVEIVIFLLYEMVLFVDC